MKLFLDPALAAHRRGRFLGALLDAAAAPAALPEAGVLLMDGKAYQGAAEQQRAAVAAWHARPGRTLLLMPPFETGAIAAGLDWRIAFRSDKAAAGDAGIAAALAAEVLYGLHGQDGASDRAAGQRWADGSAHTRYWKAHTGSGLLAATCLPLWSVSLLDQADATRAWIGALHAHTGAPESIPLPAQTAATAQAPAPEAFGLLVCLYGFGCADAQCVLARLAASPLPILALDRGRLPLLVAQLRAAGYLDDGGLTAAGEGALAASPYWAYAQRLREEHA